MTTATQGGGTFFDGARGHPGPAARRCGVAGSEFRAGEPRLAGALDDGQDVARQPERPEVAGGEPSGVGRVVRRPAIRN